VHWFTQKKAETETRENTYIMTMISREPRQVIGFAAAADKKSYRIQEFVDSAPEAMNYCTDGGYLDVIFSGRHIRNVHTKKDTHNIESINADLRHHISGLARRSRCFFRSIETLQAVISVFVDAYNKYGEAKLKYRRPVCHRSSTTSSHLHHFRVPPFSVLDFL